MGGGSGGYVAVVAWGLGCSAVRLVPTHLLFDKRERGAAIHGGKTINIIRQPERPPHRLRLTPVPDGGGRAGTRKCSRIDLVEPEELYHPESPPHADQAALVTDAGELVDAEQ